MRAQPRDEQRRPAAQGRGQREPRVAAARAQVPQHDVRAGARDARAGVRRWRRRARRARRRGRARRPCSAPPPRSGRSPRSMRPRATGAGRPAGPSNAMSASGSEAGGGVTTEEGAEAAQAHPAPFSGTIPGWFSPPISSSVAAYAPTAGGVKRTATSQAPPVTSCCSEQPSCSTRKPPTSPPLGIATSDWKDRLPVLVSVKERTALSPTATEPKSSELGSSVTRCAAPVPVERDVEVGEAGDRDVQRRGVVDVVVAGRTRSRRCSPCRSTAADRCSRRWRRAARRRRRRSQAPSWTGSAPLFCTQIERVLLALVDLHEPEVLRGRLGGERRGSGWRRWCGGGGARGEREQRRAPA